MVLHALKPLQCLKHGEVLRHQSSSQCHGWKKAAVRAILRGSHIRGRWVQEKCNDFFTSEGFCQAYLKPWTMQYYHLFFISILGAKLISYWEWGTLASNMRFIKPAILQPSLTQPSIFIANKLSETVKFWKAHRRCHKQNHQIIWGHW